MTTSPYVSRKRSVMPPVARGAYRGRRRHSNALVLSVRPYSLWV